MNDSDDVYVAYLRGISRAHAGSQLIAFSPPFGHCLGAALGETAAHANAFDDVRNSGPLRARPELLEVVARLVAPHGR